MTALAADTREWASDPVEPPDRAGWDLLIVGGGTAGLVAAKTAAQLGASVLLVERDRTGGDCLWTGCVPSKALLAAAHAASQARRADRFGVHAQEIRVDFAQVMAHVRSTIAAVEPTDSPQTLRASGVAVARGAARFTGATTARVDQQEIRFRHALVATGSAPHVPSLEGLSEAELLTSDTVWQLTELPRRLLVLGGGSIGCELGQAFARLGSSVTLVESAQRLLIREDRDAARLVHAALAADGVTIHTDTTVRSPATNGPGQPGGLNPGDFDQVLVAVGRRPRTGDMGLEDAGVRLDDRGFVAVDTRLRTSNPRIFAAGDVTGHPQFTHVAGVHASLAATNAVLGLRRRVDTATIPRVTFTQPEVAAFGVSVEHARAHPDLRVHTVVHGEVDRAIADADVVGYTRLVLDRRHRIVGASIVGPRAGESLAELVLAARHGMHARDVAAAIHAYPTYGDGAWKAAIANVQQQLTAPPARVVTGAMAAWQRRRS